MFHFACRVHFPINIGINYGFQCSERKLSRKNAKENAKIFVRISQTFLPYFAFFGENILSEKSGKRSEILRKKVLFLRQ